MSTENRTITYHGRVVEMNCKHSELCETEATVRIGMAPGDYYGIGGATVPISTELYHVLYAEAMAVGVTAKVTIEFMPVSQEEAK